MENETQIEQTWWHIEDQVKPSPIRIIRQVMDIYAVNEYLEVDIGDEKVSNVKVRSRNPEKNIAYIWRELIYINFGKLKDWPCEPNFNVENKKKRHHIRLELKYNQLEPIFRFDKWKKIHPLVGYESTLNIEGPIQPELSITVPKGMKMNSNGQDISMNLYIIGEDMVERWPLSFEKPAITQKDEKKVYTYIITSQSYNIILNSPKGASLMSRIEYKVNNQFKYISLLFVAIILIIFSIDEIYRTLFSPESIQMPNIGLLIVLFSFAGLVLSLKKEHYEIPAEKIINLSIMIALTSLLVILVIYLFKIDPNFVISKL